MARAIESLMSAMVANRMSGDRHDSNVELVAQGVANIVSPLFGRLPATGAIARTATNIRSGARIPIAGVIHALTLVIIAEPASQTRARSVGISACPVDQLHEASYRIACGTVHCTGDFRMDNVQLSQHLIAVDLRYVLLALVLAAAAGLVIWRAWAIYPRNSRRR
jgi:sulfate permease family protein